MTARPMPTGDVTFLFTDIEGSTKLWEQLPEAMRVGLARHDAIMRAAIEENGGAVFKTVGDAFCAVFQNAPDALLAAVDAQRALAEEPWGEVGQLKVRMALNSGEAELRGGDYFGQPLNRVARLLATGHGGQILVSTATRGMLRAGVPSDTGFRDLGRHRLKDLARPERVYQCVADGVPAEFKKLKSQPSPWSGMAVAPAIGLVALMSFRYTTRSSDEGLAAALSPVGLFGGLKGLVIELSTYNEWILLAVGVLSLAVALGIGFLRWRAARRQLRLSRKEPGRLSRWVVNQRTAAFFGATALLVLVAWGYQQYLWRVALPIPESALGFAVTREAAAATFQAELADTLFARGQARRVVVRELPVKFDARDTAKARAVGERIGADGVIIYRVDVAADGTRRYVAYIVFTDPDIGLALGDKPGTTNVGSQDGTRGGGEQSQPVRFKESVDVPVLRTASLAELVSAAAGIIAYDDDQAREAIKYLELAAPQDPDAPNTGIVSFYLGSAFRLDYQDGPAITTLERAAGFYERRQQVGERLGPQDELILVKIYLQRGQLSALNAGPNDFEEALTWYEKAVGLREDLLARGSGLERPTEVRATYARLYTLMADAYRGLGKSEEQRFWAKRASDESEALARESAINDPYAFVQQSAVRFFVGDCVGALGVLQQAMQLDSTNTDARYNAGIVNLLQSRPDLALEHWQAVIGSRPDEISARQSIAQMLTLRGISGDQFFEASYLANAEALYREIINLDPTNLDAHENIAELADFLGQAAIMDMTALVTDDALTVAKSQAAWQDEPDRLKTALEAYRLSIEERRILASELQPADPSAQVAVATAYDQRQDLLYSTLYALFGAPSSSPEGNQRQTTGEQILADAEQIREWTDTVLANSAASRFEELQAWNVRAGSLEREWGWYIFFAQDMDKAAALEAEYRQAVEDAITVGEAEPIGSTDEIDPLRRIYFRAKFIAAAIDQDDAEASAYDAKIQSLTSAERQQRAGTIQHNSTFCHEEQEKRAGDEFLARGDFKAAQERYEAALAVNPHHVATLNNVSFALYRQGNVQAAIARAQAAGQAAPDDYTAWSMLAFYQLVAGNGAARDAAYDYFFEIISQRPPQERMAAARGGIENLRELLDEQPTLGPRALETLPRFEEFFDAMADDGTGTYQYPALYNSLGLLALFAGDAATAEPLFRQSLALDPYQPTTHADLVISVISQGQDATKEIGAAFKETEDELWGKTTDFESLTLLGIMEQEASRYVARFPDQKAPMEKFTAAISGERERQEQVAKGVLGNVYTGPTYGHRLEWDDSWSVVEAASDGFIDVVRLENGLSNVLFEASSSYGLDVSGCLDGVIAYNRNQATWSNFTPARDADGRSLQGEAPNRAYAVFTYTEQAEDGPPGDYALYVECRILAPGELGLVTGMVSPVNVYNQQVEAVEGLLATVRAPDTQAEGAESTPEPVPISDSSYSLPKLEPMEAAGDFPGVAETTYTSPTYGFGLTWDSSWAVEAASSENDHDHLRLTNGKSKLSLDAYVEPGATPATCLRAAADEIAANPEFSGLMRLRDADGALLSGYDESSAYAVLTYTSHTDGVVEDWALYVLCRSLEADGAILRISHVIPRDQYDNLTPERESLLQTLVLSDPSVAEPTAAAA